MAILSSIPIQGTPDVRTISLDVSAIPANRVQEETFAVPDLLVTDHVVVTKPTDDPRLHILGARVTAVDTLAIKFMLNGGPTLDPAVQDFFLLVSRPA